MNRQILALHKGGISTIHKSTVKATYKVVNKVLAGVQETRQSVARAKNTQSGGGSDFQGVQVAANVACERRACSSRGVKMGREVDRASTIKVTCTLCGAFDLVSGTALASQQIITMVDRMRCLGRSLSVAILMVELVGCSVGVEEGMQRWSERHQNKPANRRRKITNVLLEQLK